MYNTGERGGFTMSFHGVVPKELGSNNFTDWLYSDDIENEDEVFFNEKSAIVKTLGHPMAPQTKPSGICRVKNSQDSIKYRQYGNELYNAKMPDERTHEKVWRFYTQSIALAPNGSLELALGYGNRSALLLHLGKYKDCIEDCNKAIDITSSYVLKCKLMCRKVECLALLNDGLAEQTCKDTLQKLSKFSIAEDSKKIFSDKLQNILSNLTIENSDERTTEQQEDSPELPDLKYQKEAPCASTSIKISYNKQWGRHVTANKDIKPGDIVAIANNFCTLLSEQGMYIFCSNCAQPAWSSIPCKRCIFDVYCSEECMSDAWKKYHKYECPVYPYIWDIDQKISEAHHAIRFLLIMIHQAGGIEQLKTAIENIEHCKDHRTAGFSFNGIFVSDQFNSMYSQMRGDESNVYVSKIHEARTNVILLATKTDLFGKKMDYLRMPDLLKNNNILFVGALLTRIRSRLQNHSFLVKHEFGEEKVDYGMCFNAFNSCFNHSCNPNAELVLVKNNKTLIYAKHPIQKGEQLFVSYHGVHYLGDAKEQRQKDLKQLFHSNRYGGFKCDCLPCTENWSNICVPSSAGIFELTPSLEAEFQDMIDSTTKCIKIPVVESNFSLESVEKIKRTLEKLSSKITVHCTDYYTYEKRLQEFYIRFFGSWKFDLSHTCVKA